MKAVPVGVTRRRTAFTGHLQYAYGTSLSYRLHHKRPKIAYVFILQARRIEDI